jgi:peptide deformylase
MLYTIGPRYKSRGNIGVFELGNDLETDRTGVGLAAPQTGNCIRLVVIAAPGYPEMAMVNPVIERHKGWELGSEGCLSLPGETGGVYRYTDIWITYQDLNGKPRRMKARDYQARVIQHEIDHLDGIEFTDRIEEQQEVYA